MTAVASDLLLDPKTGDLKLIDGDLALSTGMDAVAQALRQRLNFFRGEWFCDLSIGLPAWQEILGKKNPDLSVIREVFRQEALKTPGVASVANLEVTMSGRRAIINISVRMDDGSLLVTDGIQVGA